MAKTCCELSADIPQESTENLITLPDDDPDIVTLVLVYLYSKNYDMGVIVPPALGYGEANLTASAEVAASDSFFESSCRCGRDVEEAEMVICDKCLTCQHASCYYPNGVIPGANLCHYYTARNIEKPAKLPKLIEVLRTTKSRESGVHLAVYACADKFGISSLKTLAQEKFMAATRGITDVAFARSLEVVYENTAPGDNGLRAVVTQKLLELKPKVADVPEVAEVLKKHEPMVWGIIQAYTKDLEIIIEGRKQLAASLASSEREMDLLRRDLKGKDDQLKGQYKQSTERQQAYDALKNFVEGQTNLCMGCGKQLDVVEVSQMGQGRIRIICAICKRAHTFD